MRYLLICFVLQSFFAFSQTQGYFKYNIEIEPVDSAETIVRSTMLMKESFMEIYFAPEKIRINYKTGDFYKNSIISHRDSSVTMVLMENGYGKFAQYYKDTTFIQSVSEDDVAQVDSSTFIALNGFKCFKVNALVNGDLVTYWCTNDIDPVVSGFPISHPIVPGFPIKFTKIDAGVRMTYQMSNFRLNEPVLESVFPLKIPFGYTFIE